MDQIFIQHRFTIQRDGLFFSDALVMLESEYNALSEEDIELLKEERFTNWKTFLENSSQEED